MIVDGRNKLFVFLDRRDVEPTNNASERALRPSRRYRRTRHRPISRRRPGVSSSNCQIENISMR